MKQVTRRSMFVLLVSAAPVAAHYIREFRNETVAMRIAADKGLTLPCAREARELKLHKCLGYVYWGNQRTMQELRLARAMHSGHKLSSTP